MHIPRYHKLGHLLDMAYNNYFLIDTQFLYNLAAFLSSLQFFSNLSTGLLLSLIDSSIEIVLDNEIKVYRNTAVVKQISELVLQYPSI